MAGAAARELFLFRLTMLDSSAFLAVAVLLRLFWIVFLVMIVHKKAMWRHARSYVCLLLCTVGCIAYVSASQRERGGPLSPRAHLFLPPRLSRSSYSLVCGHPCGPSTSLVTRAVSITSWILSNNLRRSRPSSCFCKVITWTRLVVPRWMLA